MFLTLIFVVSNFLPPTKCFLCNVTNNNKTPETFSIINFQNKCYLFDKDKRTYKNAYEFCRRNNGILTDVDKDFRVLIEKASNESTRLEDVYWIGLFWTKIWDDYIWASGANYVKPNSFIDNKFGQCVKYDSSSKCFENLRCDHEYASICMFSLKTEDVNEEETSRCSHVCEAFQVTYGQTTTELITTISTTTSNLQMVNMTVSPYIPTTTEGNTTTKTTCFCPKCDSDTEHETGTKTPFTGQDAPFTNITPLAVLGALLAVSVLVNLMAFVMFCRKRIKYHSDMGTLKSISMVDKLSFDSHSLNYANINMNMETGVDYHIKAKPDGESPGHQDMDTNVSMDRNITSDVSKEASVELDSQSYSCLDHKDVHKITRSEESNVYGIGSVMAGPSKRNQDLNILLKQENSLDGLNLYSN